MSQRCNYKQIDYTRTIKDASHIYILRENVILNREIQFLKCIPYTFH